MGRNERAHKQAAVLVIGMGLALILSIAGFVRGSQGVASGPGGEAAVRVVFIPADGGTATGTIADFKPLFAALTETSGMHFELAVTQSYSAAVEALCNGSADMAFVGPATYLQARQRRCAQLIATGVRRGRQKYYSGIFVRKDAPFHALADLRGASVAFGDINSTSSFLMPVAMLLDAGVDPASDLGQVRITGSHSSSLTAVVAGKVDAAALSFDSFDRALQQGLPGVDDLRVLARSDAMPYPPFVVSTRLSATRRKRLRQAFAAIEHGQRALPGYAGRPLDSYSPTVDQTAFDALSARLAPLTAERVAAILDHANQ
ncbi:MAG: phosphate/phosphite/phosphonate ABC transporter substrate-binding protein [Novosphingobium sp.]|nr:phosphate/phosphite/phosphonate ABC transporter substrate-binding protein [Novosphingobium sp.]